MSLLKYKKSLIKHRLLTLTLLEVIIALALLAILLSVSFSFFRQISIKNIEIQKLKQKISERQHFQTRLSQVFSELTHDTSSSEAGQESFCFYSDSINESRSSALIFIFNQDIDTDPDFCNKVKAKLYLNLKKQLCLNIRPCHEQKTETAFREEVLLENIDAINFQFFDPEKNTLEPDWEKKNTELPPLMKIEIKPSDKEEAFDFNFFFPQSNHIPVYKHSQEMAKKKS
jgi:type II secretory pathway pseudopilin PulG